MTPYWRDLCASKKMNFLPFEDPALSFVEEKFKWKRTKISASRFPGLSGSFEALNFSDFYLFPATTFRTTSLTRLLQSFAKRQRSWKASIATFRRRIVPLLIH